MAKVTQAERDYVATLHDIDGDALSSSLIRLGRAAWVNKHVRAVIDYIRANPLPEQGNPDA